MSFQKPGSRSKAAFGISFDSGQKQHHAAECTPQAAKPEASSSQKRTVPQGGQHAGRAGAHSARSMQRGEPLPVERYRKQLLWLVEQHAVVIVLGETGSGKTTQIPQYLLEAGWAGAGYQIAITQPRRAAAASVAARVAEELGEELGQTVGFAVRFDSATTEGVTKLKFITDGVLLREMMEDPLLTRYSVVMVDEAHERSLATDMLLGLLRKVQQRRPQLRVIVSSATLEAGPLLEFYAAHHHKPAQNKLQNQQQGLPANRNPAVISMEGRTFPVEVHYAQEPCKDYVAAAVHTAVDIHKADLPGDILVFLTGQQEVEEAVRQLDAEAQHLAHSTRYGLKLLPLPLYAGLPGHAQASALADAPRGWRKVVVATNIAETSLTLPGVVYVVDCCYVKQRAYNPLLGLEALCVAPSSKASAAQRAGRAGRVRAGKVFRVCTRDSYEQLLPDRSVPEMQRSDLTGMVLQLKALGIDNILKFGWLSPPPAEALIRALENLAALRVLDRDARLTSDVGLKIAALPVEPALGAALLNSFTREWPCSEELLTIVACMSAAPHGVFMTAAAAGGPHTLDQKKSHFAVAEGDLVTLLNVWRAWQENGRSRKWCVAQCLNHHALNKAWEVRQQLVAACKRMGLPAAESSDGDMDHVRKALVSGLFMNAATYERTDYNPLAPDSDPGTHVYRLVRPVGGASTSSIAVSGAVDAARLRLRVHAQSVLARCQPAWIVFANVQQSDSGWYEMQHVTAIERDWLLEVAPHYYQELR